MSTYAQVENNIVVNTVVADAEWIAQQPGTWILYDETNPCGIGWSVENGVCVIPTPIPDPVDPPTAPVAPKTTTK
jgi:hypothetical protein